MSDTVHFLLASSVIVIANVVAVTLIGFSGLSFETVVTLAAMQTVLHAIRRERAA